jgi:hypothetical protein
MLQCSVVAVGPSDPIVTERDTGQIHPGFRGIYDAGQSDKGQVTTQNAMRAAAGQSGEQLLRAGHLTTVAHREAGSVALP